LSRASEDERLARAVLRLNGVVLGLALGTAAGLALFVATNWLVLKGGEPVGPHLSLLSQFFLGYSVTFAGSFVGMAYGFALGYFAGWLIARVYNSVVLLKRGHP
jgi:hypothetical protein